MELVNSPPVYHTSAVQKARSKNAAHRFKYGSPKLVEMMREKCRLRFKEARSEHLLRKRNIVQEEKGLLESIVRQELSELEEDIKLQELIFQELIAEANEWLFEEYERSGSYMIDEYGHETMFCPVCQKNEMSGGEPPELIQCPCGSRFRYPNGIEQFGILLRETVEQHGAQCETALQFFLEPLADSNFGQMNAFCPACDYYKNLTK